MVFEIVSIVFLGVFFLIFFFFLGQYMKNMREAKINKENEGVANFLSFFIETLTVFKDTNKAFSIINDYIKKRANLDASYIIFTRKGDINNLEILHGDNDFPNVAYFGAVMYDNHITIRQGGIFHQILKNRKVMEFSYSDLQELMDKSLLSKCRSIVVVPLFLSDTLEGIACFTQAKERKFHTQKISFLKSYCNYLVLAKKYIESYASFQEQEGLRKELQVARQIQKKLMPLFVPKLGEFNLVAMNCSAKDVSGDFYDFIDIDENKTLIVIGDASGKGIPACIIGIMARTLIRSLAIFYNNLGDILLRLNDSLFEDLESNRFITVAFALIDKRNNIIECVRGGHTSILLKNVSNKIIDIKPKGTAIGILPTKETTIFETFSMIFPKGCEMMLFSDGLVEQTNNQEEEFNLDRLKESWFKNDEKNDSLTKVAEGIFSDIKNYADEMPICDDQTLILISRN